jgi:acetyl esterase/lipase
MPTRSVHPDLRRGHRLLPRSAVSPATLPITRAGVNALTLRRSSRVRVEPVTRQVSVRLHGSLGRATRSPALLWIHGGGYVLGRAQQDDGICRRISANLGIVVAAVDYRVAPEHPFPTPLEDCYTALRWLAAQPGVDPTRIAVGGASAGGGLAAALAILARDRGEIAPAFQLLAYPMLDDRTATRTDIDETNLRLWNSRSNAFAWQAYTGRTPGSPDVPPLAAPARYDDLAGLAPAWIGVGTLDLFHDECVTYAQRLRAAGVGCDLAVVPGAFHGFDLILPRAQVSRNFRAAYHAALRPALHG